MFNYSLSSAAHSSVWPIREALGAALEPRVKMLQHQVCMWRQWSSDQHYHTHQFCILQFKICTCAELIFYFFFTISFRRPGAFAHVSSAELLAVNASRWSSPTSCCTSPSSSISWSFYAHLQVSQPKRNQPCRYKSMPLLLTVLHSTSHKADTDLCVLVLKSHLCQELFFPMIRTGFCAYAQGQESWSLPWKQNLHTQRSIRLNLTC